jgi:3-dehydroquinate synthase
VPVSFSVHSNIRDYDVYVQHSPDFIGELAHHPQACFVVDENVWKLYAATLLKDLPVADTIVFPISEDRKNLDSVQELYDQLVTRSAKRNLTLISFGGGILQDITGFTSSTIYRGIHWIYIPTTLLAQADSCIGSKTSLNFRGYKNLVGTFYPPAQIHIYIPFLVTQQDADFFSGFGEVVKLHLMGGEELFRDLCRSFPAIVAREPASLLHAIKVSLNVKLSYMAGDEYDTGRRNLLNYGHDFGHALESTSGFAVPHGQAVIFGMLAANLVARNRGLLDKALEAEIAHKLLIPSLKIRPVQEAIEPGRIIAAQEKDKKRTGDLLALIMMQDNFNFICVNDLTPDEVFEVLAESKKTLNL